MSDERPDFDAIRATAAKEGINLQEVAIVYDELSESELTEMISAGLVAESSGPKILGRFGLDGAVMFPEKATAAIYLGA
jgi:hypothetical protein